MENKIIQMIGSIVGLIVGIVLLFSPINLLGIIILILTLILTFIDVEEDTTK